MPETDWRSVVAHLRDGISGPPAPAMIEFAETIGLVFDRYTPRGVVTALLLRHLNDVFSTTFT